MHLFYFIRDEKRENHKKYSSRELLYKAIDKYCKGTCEDISDKRKRDIKLNKNGKPYIDDFANFSISHTENIWVVIFSKKICGLDIQVPRNGKLKKMGEKIFSEQDNLIIKKKGEPAFFKLWTRKEAYVKALGETIFTEVPSLWTEDNKVYLDGYTIFDINFIEGIYSAISIEGILEEIKDINITRI